MPGGFSEILVASQNCEEDGWGGSSGKTYHSNFERNMPGVVRGRVGVGVKGGGERGVTAASTNLTRKRLPLLYTVRHVPRTRTLMAMRFVRLYVVLLVTRLVMVVQRRLIRTMTDPARAATFRMRPL